MRVVLEEGQHLVIARGLEQPEAADDFFDSAKGPSVTVILPAAPRTTRPSALSRSA
jgi:hypothetical protein